jgi:hypothetical protein
MWTLNPHKNDAGEWQRSRADIPVE